MYLYSLSSSCIVSMFGPFSHTAVVITCLVRNYIRIKLLKGLLTTTLFIVSHALTFWNILCLFSVSIGKKTQCMIYWYYTICEIFNIIGLELELFLNVCITEEKNFN